jgi:capsular exopolysaccharide synthesis family protein
MGEISDALRRAAGAPKPKPPLRERSDLDPPRRRTSEPPPPPHERRRPAPPTNAASTAQPPPPARRREALRTDGDPRFSAARITLADPLGPATQQYRRLAFRIRESAEARGARSIVVTSARPLDGKTTTACNLAVQLARLDKALSVILVDLDLRRAGVANSFGFEPEVPVDAVLRGDRRLDDAIVDTDVPGLALLGLSTPAADAETLLALPSLERMIGELSRRFDFVVIDTPPVLATSDAQVILRHADAGIFVARTGKSPVKAVSRALDHIQTRKLLGSVLNASRTQHGLTDYPYYGYGTTGGSSEARGDPNPMRTEATNASPDPGVDGAAPDVDVAAPGVDVDAPGVDVDAPGVDAAARDTAPAEGAEDRHER